MFARAVCIALITSVFLMQAVFVYAQELVMVPYDAQFAMFIETPALPAEQHDIFLAPQQRTLCPYPPEMWLPPEQVLYERSLYRLIDSDALFDFEMEISRIELIERDIFFNVYNRPQGEQNEDVRAMWASLLGFDVWYPYFQAKKIEKKIKEKVSIKIFRFKGSPTYDNDTYTYTFKCKF